ncbi:hypothetical protein ANN_01923 [Periplaneta americana]|uniref:Reverse transcriptase n=1 Tax=Periplaneta americana TaxID=6978 RepID=A0ABQ8TX94_PERAM|nr:hypothetical protein ANN_01923 [Periplaneta americana]
MLEKGCSEVKKLAVEIGDDNNALSDSAMIISYKICHEIGKELKTFNEGEFIKRCLIILADELCPQQVGEVEAIRLSRRRLQHVRMGYGKPRKNLNQVTCPNWKSNQGHLVSQPDALTVTPQVWTRWMDGWMDGWTVSSKGVEIDIRSCFGPPSWISAQNLGEAQSTQPVRTTRAGLEDHRWSADHSLRNADLSQYRAHKHIQGVPKMVCKTSGTVQNILLLPEYRPQLIISFTSDILSNVWHSSYCLTAFRNSLTSFTLLTGVEYISAFKCLHRVPPANSWIRNHKCLTLSEWIDALKMVGYVAPVRAVPGRSRDGTRCRRCLSEIETLPHILGFCPYSEALRNIRHHAVCSMLAEALKEVGFTVHQEVQGLATQGSVRRIDIIAIKNNSAYILDPTIRFETHADQPHEVDSEKKRIYEPTIPFYKDKYSLSHIDVIGLMVGARGTIPSFFANKCKNLGLTNSIVKEIAISALKGSIQILRNHLYGSDNVNFKLS